MENAIAFARYRQGNFGWGVDVPGYNFTVASTSRPLDAAAAASLATSGVFAPLLLTDQAADAAARARELPAERAARLRGRPRPGGLQPRLDPRRRQAVSLPAQARLDRITELIPVQATAP